MRTTLFGFSVIAAAVLAGCGGGGSASYAPSSPGGYYAPAGNGGYGGGAYPAPAAYETLFTRGFGALHDALRRRCDTLGARVTVGDVTGVAPDIADDGALLLRTDDGRLVDVRVGDVR